jgi:hypothetical protein
MLHYQLRQRSAIRYHPKPEPPGQETPQCSIFVGDPTRIDLPDQPAALGQPNVEHDI